MHLMLILFLAPLGICDFHDCDVICRINSTTEEPINQSFLSFFCAVLNMKILHIWQNIAFKVRVVCCSVKQCSLLWQINSVIKQTQRNFNPKTTVSFMHDFKKKAC